MENEIGSDIELIEDENMLRKMLEKTEDYRKKKEIRMRMFKLREQHLKELYTTEDMIQSNATSERFSTSTHTKSMTDQGFITKKTKEINHSESPSEGYRKKLNTNTNFLVKEVKPKEKSLVKLRENVSIKEVKPRVNTLIKKIKPSSDEGDEKYLDDKTTLTVADRVSKFFKNVTTKNEEKTKKTVKNLKDEKYETKITHIDVHDSSKNANIHNTVLTRKISGASGYKARKDFFENKMLNYNSEIEMPKITQNITKQTTPVTKCRSPDQIIKSPIKIMNTEIFDVKVEEINESRRISGSKTIKDRKAAFEKVDVAENPARENEIAQRNQSSISVMNTDRLLEIYTKSSVVPDKPSENVSTRKVTSPNISEKSEEKSKTFNSINKVSESAGETVSSNSADKNVAETHRNRKKIEEIFDLHVLELMLEKAMGYDQKRRVIAQIRSVKRRLEPTIRGKDTTKSPEPVPKTKSIIKRHIEEPNVNDEKYEIKIAHIDVHDSSENTNIHNPVSTRKISGASDYISRREFFEYKKLNNNSDIVIPITTPKIVRSSIINLRASFEVNDDKKTLLKDKSNVPKQTTPDTKCRSPDQIFKSPIKIMNTEIFDVKVEEMNKSRRILESKTMKDRKAAFEKIDVAETPAREYKFTLKSQSPISVMNTDRLLEMYNKSSVVPDKPSENITTRRVTSPNISKKRAEKTKTIDSINNVSEGTGRTVSLNSPDRNVTETPERSTANKKRAEKTKTIDSINNVSDSADGTVSSNSADKNVAETPERSTAKCFEEKPTDSKIDTSRNRNEQYTATETVSVPINTSNVIKATTVHNANDEIQNLLELMLEKAVGYDNRRRIIAQIRKAKLQIEPSNNDKDSKNAVTRSSKESSGALIRRSPYHHIKYSPPLFSNPYLKVEYLVNGSTEIKNFKNKIDFN
ncbi:Smoothelin [Cinara cedri]|uniref:Smoothelin n=1 Tax=Cinara cedri TaxID=506608 RepID=A0A5E4MIE2_9HEMI|nr:Smoothelin [Cinara cedri]